jgi:hypothetical protein
MQLLQQIALALGMAFSIPAAAQAQPFNPAPWLADLEQARAAFHEKYANLEWLESERGVAIDPLFDDLARRLSGARSDVEAYAVFDRLKRKVRDGHVEIDWPRPPAPAHKESASTSPAPPSPPRDPCAQLGYDGRQNRAGTAQGLPRYRPLDEDRDNPFDAGLVTSGTTQVGVLRIGIFQPQGYPQSCQAALRAFDHPADKPCDEECQDKVLTLAYRDLTASLERRIRQLEAARASVLLVDLTGNGGGSEWAEAAARMFTPKLLVSERLGYVRGEHWTKQWRNLAAQLTDYAKSAKRDDRARLLGWAAEAEAAAACPQTCGRIGTAGYATGLVGSAAAGTFAGKDWGVYVFSPAQYPYRDGVWDGPLIVLVDQETWSAAEEFAALLQDNQAAVVMGARTGGAGCGYTWGGTPTVLENSGAVLKLPDCLRYRADGSNEVRGIVPDVPVAIRADDGVELRARMIAEQLPAAIARAAVSAPAVLTASD